MINVDLSRVNLSRLAITGPITLDTPLIVLKEIADAHSIEYDRQKIEDPRYLVHVLETINTKKIHVVTQPYDKQDYKLIARFVNKNCHWRKKTLDQAFNLLLQYTGDKITETHLEFNYGLQTPDHPDNLNACVLYGICQANRISTSFNSTLDEMASNIKLLFCLRNHAITHTVKHLILDTISYGGCENYQLINILSQLDPERSRKIIQAYSEGDLMDNWDELSEITIEYSELQVAASEIRLRDIKVLPRTHTEAIVMSAIYYKIDISEVRNPLAEYQEICRNPYFPIDPYLSERIRDVNLHPDSVLNPSLCVIFNPYLPPELYDEDDLNQMCLREGFTEDEIREESSYSLLQSSCFEPTFFHGKQGNIINMETTMLDEIESLEYDRIVVYGIRGDSMSAYTYGELTDTFRSYKRFQSPDQNNETFLDRTIEKLYIICNDHQKPSESMEIFRERIQLAEEIERVKLYINTNQAQVMQLLDLYEKYSDENKKKIQDFMELLLKSGMYMRGWNGEGSYPLRSRDTVTTVEQQPEIDLRVTKSIIEIEETLEKLNQLDGVGDLLRQIPLIFYNENSEELLVSSNPEEGLTIYERINIVKGGENGSIQSCIRMSSNRFVASAYYYMKLLGIPVPFNIEEMSHIQ